MRKGKIMKKSDSKRILIGSDLHCGSLVGIIHPDDPRRSHDKELNKITNALWKFYSGVVDSFDHIDFFVINGDAIEGKAKKNGGNEVLTTNLSDQVDIAQRVIQYSHANKYMIIGGTEYHTRLDGENFEEVLAKQIGREHCIYSNGGHFRFSFDGVVYPTVFNFKHFMGGRAWNTRTGALKRYLDGDMIEVSKGNKDMPTDILVRSHIHIFDYVKGIRDDTLAVSTPALQAKGTTFGQLKCDGEYSIGLLEFVIERTGKWAIKPHIAKIPSLMSKVQDI